MLAPLSPSLLRYGPCLLPITLERCLFSKITTTIWSGCGTVAFSFLGAGGRTVRCGFSGVGSTLAPGLGSTPASRVGSTPASVVGSTPAPGLGSTLAPGLGSTPASRVGSTPASVVGSTPAPGLGSTLALVFVGSVGTPVRKLLGGAGDPVGGGSATAQAADANSNIPAAAQPDWG